MVGHIIHFVLWVTNQKNLNDIDWTNYAILSVTPSNAASEQVTKPHGNLFPGRLSWHGPNMVLTYFKAIASGSAIAMNIWIRGFSEAAALS